MQIRFLLGPAGSGKTFRCRSEIRAALAAAPDGPPLLLLAPKQATFQLERQLLAPTERPLSPQVNAEGRAAQVSLSPEPTERPNRERPPHPVPLPLGGGEGARRAGEGALQGIRAQSSGPGHSHPDPVPGYTRLHILSFERLAHFLFRRCQRPPPSFLNEEGRVMVLRALLAKRRDSLKLFRASARLTGFARQLSDVLRELQRHQLTPETLSRLADAATASEGLPLKLHDLATLLQQYLAWLDEHDLQDADALLDAARTTLLECAAEIRIENLWLDGFAELSPQELDLLAALIPFCSRATLAFCLDPAASASASGLSHWSVVRRTFEDCHKRMNALPGADVLVESLPRDPRRNRFHASSDLAHLERSWAIPKPIPNPESTSTLNPQPSTTLRLFACPDPEAEATLAAREILGFVRSGGRFREVAILVRNLELYQEPLQRVFTRYEIPFFLDRREPVTHHPLAELTRSAVRTAALQWTHEDWFAALKTGLVPVADADIDRLENETLARGWKGPAWLQSISIPDDPEQSARLEKIRQQIVPPFQTLARRLAGWQNRPTGPQLDEAVREFWTSLDVEQQLERWTAVEVSGSGLSAPGSVHATVWDQMNAWLDNVALAFAHEALPLREWLPILEAGLAGLSVGLIPPALDQVLVGAVDRSRNPELKAALVLGLNEGVFPATPDEPTILTDADCADLARLGVSLHSTLRERAARERYFGYIACTRASEQLTLTFSRRATDGQPLNPSPFIAHLRRMFPELGLEEFHPPIAWADVIHTNELAPLLAETQNSKLETRNFEELLHLPRVRNLDETLRQLRHPDPAERLSPEMAAALYGPVLRTSVSRLEEFAACPFRFFVHSGLRADERRVFELDAREQGTFQHDALKLFHEQLTAEGKRWRDLTPTEARERIGKIATALASGFRDGLLRDSAQARFMAGVLARSLQDFIEVIVGWMRSQYEFDPAAVELEFGSEAGTPPGETDLGDGHKLVLRGRIDRVDLFRPTEGSETLAVVLDYKSGQKSLDPVLLEHGVQLQLPAYLNALRRWPDPRPLGATRLRPAGVFYVNLRGRFESAATRAEALVGTAESRKSAYRHTGRFDFEALPQLDRVLAADQFNYRLKKDGQPYGSSVEVMLRADFEQLLDHVDKLLVEMGRRIYAGEAAVDPYRKGRQTPCEYCDYRPICRIDPWTHRYRTLAKTEGPDDVAVRPAE